MRVAAALQVVFGLKSDPKLHFFSQHYMYIPEDAISATIDYVNVVVNIQHIRLVEVFYLRKLQPIHLVCTCIKNIIIQ